MRAAEKFNDYLHSFCCLSRDVYPILHQVHHQLQYSNSRRLVIYAESQGFVAHSQVLLSQQISLSSRGVCSWPLSYWHKQKLTNKYEGWSDTLQIPEKDWQYGRVNDVTCMLKVYQISGETARCHCGYHIWLLPTFALWCISLLFGLL